MKRDIGSSIGLFLYLIIISLITIPSALSQPGIYHLKLLAVHENGFNFTGSDADLYLELREGSGRVFIETFPLTKMDTQISTRFAKEIACKHFSLDCNDYDFIYTIKSGSSIIGGPSAGAAISALTAIAVLDLPYDQSATITGTINSGGIIGPVGGTKEKIQAAEKIGLKKVLVAKGSLAKTNSSFNDSSFNSTSLPSNQTSSPSSERSSGNIPSDYLSPNSSLKIIEVLSLDEVLFHLTGKDLDPKDYGLPSDEDYNNIMKSLQVALCQRTDEIMKDLDPLEKNLSAEINSIKEKAINSTNGQDYYSAASYCFSNNIKVKKEYYFQKKVSPISLAVLVKNLNSKTEALEDKLSEQKIDTISDLQALMIVKERISDVKKNVQKANSSLTGLETITYLSYGEERLFTAISWMQFFDLDGKKFAVDQDSLRNSCLQKIAESEERYQYALLFLPENYLLHIEEKIAQAEESLGLGENELCLITASQAKADANAILSTFGLDEQSLPRFIQAKRLAVEKTITRNSAEGTFPILGYSYYRYALTFEESEPYTSLLYLEYALEMSELEIYFPEESTVSIFSNLRFSKEIYIFAFGLVVGIILSALYQVLKPKKNFKKEL